MSSSNFGAGALMSKLIIYDGSQKTVFKMHTTSNLDAGKSYYFLQHTN